jgi:hypothetical protein
MKQAESQYTDTHVSAAWCGVIGWLTCAAGGAVELGIQGRFGLTHPGRQRDVRVYQGQYCNRPLHYHRMYCARGHSLTRCSLLPLYCLPIAAQSSFAALLRELPHMEGRATLAWQAVSGLLR